MSEGIREFAFEETFDAYDPTQIDTDYGAYFSVRRDVFCDEQKCPMEEEDDGLDKDCRHFALFRGKRAMAVCRIRPVGPYLKLERVACRKEARGRGCSQALVVYILRLVQRHYPNLLIAAHAQSTVLPFYERLGFVVVSAKEFDESGILHRTIVYPPRRDRIRNLSLWDPRTFDGHDSVVEGDAYDGDVREAIGRLMREIEKGSFVPLVAYCNTLIEVTVIGSSLLRLLIDLALRVQSAQSWTIDGYSATSPVSRQIDGTEDVELLRATAWEKLNTGHYSLVDENWRYFYSLLALTLAIDSRAEEKKSLLWLDRGLLMGRDTVDGVLSMEAEKVARGITVEGMDFGGLANSTRDASVLSASRPVSVVDGPMDELRFLEEYVIPSKPVLIKGAVKHWKACEKWTFDWFLERHGARTVPVEIGSKYTEDDWSQRLMTIEQFFGKALGAEPGRPLYLAQHRLFVQIPSLREDVEVPSECVCGSTRMEDVDLNLWMGLADTVSPLHTDPRENMFCQVRGRKFVRLVSPSFSDRVGAFEEGILTNTSQKEAETLEGVECWDAEVCEGDALFIPRTWWHFVRALTPSISVSCWFDL